jgi:hypothetical protein
LRHRRAGLPAASAAVEDVMEHVFLLPGDDTGMALRLTAVDPAEATVLVGTCEPTIDSTWRREMSSCESMDSGALGRWSGDDGEEQVDGGARAGRGH